MNCLGQTEKHVNTSRKVKYVDLSKMTKREADLFMKHICREFFNKRK